MFQVGQIVAPITADLRDFTKGIARAKMKGSNAAKDIRKSFQDIGAGMQNIGRNMTMGITAPLVGAGALAIKTAGDYERLRVAMDTLNGSVEEGGRQFDRLQKLSAGTPFQLKDLAQAQNMLQGFSLTADEAFNSVKMIGDIAAITGADINGIGIAFGQAAAEGKAMTRDIRQFINQGVPIIQMLADTMGVAESEILSLAEQGEITFDVLNRAFREATSSGGLFADGMQRQSKTIQGVLSTLRDNFSIALGEIGQSLVDTFDIKGLIKDLTASIQTGIKWFNSLSEDVKRAAFTIAGVLGASGPIMVALGTLSVAIGAISAPVVGVVAAIGAGAAAIIMHWEEVEAYFTSGGGSQMWKDLQGIVTSTIDVIKSVWGIFGEDVMRITKDAFLVIVEVVEGALSKINNSIKFWAKLFNGDIKGALGVAVDDFKNSFGSIKDIVGSIGELAWSVQPARIWGSAIKNIFSSAKDEAWQFGTVLQSSLNDGLKNAGKQAWQFGQNVKITSDQAKSASTKSSVLKENVDRLTNSYKNFSVAINEVNDKPLFDPMAVDEAYRLQQSVKDLYTPISELIDIEIELGEKMEVTRKGMSDAAQMGVFFGQQLGQAFAQAIVFSDKLGDSIKNIGKQLASRGIVNFLGLAMSGGLTGLFSGGLLGGIGKLFGGIFHDGGMVPGQGEKMILAKGGEMVLTQSQQKALSMDRGGGMSAGQISKAFEMALDRKLQKLSENEIYVMSQRGRRGY